MVTQLHDSVLALFAALTLHNKGLAQMLVGLMELDDDIHHSGYVGNGGWADRTQNSIHIWITDSLTERALVLDRRSGARDIHRV